MPDSGKRAAKDSKSDNNAGQTQQSAANPIIAGGSILVQANAGNADSQGNADQTNSGNGDPTAESSDPSAAQAVPDANQSLAIAQLSDSNTSTSDKTDGTSGMTGADAAGDPLVALPDSNSQKSTTAAQNVPVTGNDNTGGASASPGDTSSTVPSGAPQSSKAGKARGDDQAAIAAQRQTADANAPANAATPPSAPAAKKDHKSDKPRDRDNSDAANNQTAAATPATVAAPSAIVAASPAPAVIDSTASTNNIIAANAVAAVQTGQGAAKNSQAASNPPAGRKTPAPSDQAAGNTAKPNSGSQTLPAGAPGAAQDNSISSGGNAAQAADAKPTAANDDKSGPQTVPAPVQPPAQAPQQPPQLQAVTPQPQAHAGPAAAVTQNVQVSQSDPGANANTVGALAVAIAVKSQSGNKQFDIRLDPPELGRVEVRLSIDAAGKAQASLSADQPRTLDLLKADAPTLTRALRDAGLNVSQDGLNFSLRGQNQQSGGNSFTPRSGRASQISLTATSAIGFAPSGANYQGPADGRLDIRV
jgi:flagellar hook-length control protein FliK